VKDEVAGAAAVYIEPGVYREPGYSNLFERSGHRCELAVLPCIDRGRSASGVSGASPARGRKSARLRHTTGAPTLFLAGQHPATAALQLIKLMKAPEPTEVSVDVPDEVGHVVDIDNATD